MTETGMGAGRRTGEQAKDKILSPITDLTKALAPSKPKILDRRLVIETVPFVSLTAGVIEFQTVLTSISSLYRIFHYSKGGGVK